MQDDFFRRQLRDRSTPVPTFMSAQAFATVAPPAAVPFSMPAPGSTLPALPTLPTLPAMPAWPAVPADFMSNRPPEWDAWMAFRLDAARQTAADRYSQLTPSAADWLARQSDFDLDGWMSRQASTLPAFDPAGFRLDLNRRLNSLPQAADWAAARRWLDTRLPPQLDRAQDWLRAPETAAAIDRLRPLADRWLDRLLQTPLDPRLSVVLADLPEWAAPLARDANAEEAVAAIDEARQRLAGELERWRQLPTATLLKELDGRLQQVRTEWPQWADRLQAELPAAADRLTDQLTAQLDRLPAAPMSDWTAWADLADLSALPNLPAPPNLPNLANLANLANLPDLANRSSLAGWQPTALVDSLQMRVDRLQIQPDWIAADRIEFGIAGARFQLQDGFFGQRPNSRNGLDSFLYVGPTALNLSGGEFARFQDLRFELRTAPGEFEAAASVADLQLQFNHQSWRLAAAAVTIGSTAAGLRVRGVIYPHDERAAGAPGGSPAGIYFEAGTSDLSSLDLLQRFQQLATAGDWNQLFDLLATRPRLLSDDFLVVFNGRAARLLQNQWNGRLDGGTRLLIDALSGLDDGYRTVAIRGAQVARMRELAAGRQYSTLVESAREVVPEIDLLYSHYLRRFGGRPESMDQPQVLMRAGPFDAVVGASEGAYAAQWFGGLCWRLPGPASGIWSHRLTAGWLYEQAGVGEIDPGDPTVLYPQYNYERAGFLQYRYNGWAVAYETMVRPTWEIDAHRRVVFGTQLTLGVRQADYLSFANENKFDRPKEFLARYDQPSPIGNVFPIFHAETSLQLEVQANGRLAWLGVGCDADFGYGQVARGLNTQLPLVPELTPKAFLAFDRPLYRLQLLGAWPTAVDEVPYAACQLTWDLDRVSIEW